MGNSGSKSNSSQTITNNIVNKNYMDTLNKNIMNVGVEVLIKNSSACSSAVNLNNSCNMSGSNIGGDFDFGGNQANQASVNFSCIQANKSSSDMSTAMMNQMMAEMKALSGTEAAAQLNNAASSSNQTGFGSTGGISKSNADTTVNTNITNSTISRVQNIYEQNLKNNFTAETVSECIGKTTLSNSQNLANINVEGNAKVSCIQANTLQQVQQCKQLNDAVTKTSQETFQTLGLTVQTDNETKQSVEATNTTTSENISTGAIQDTGTALADVIGSFGGLLGLGFLGQMLSPLCIFCSCILCLCLIVVGFYYSTSGSDGASGLSSGISSGLSSGISSDIISSNSLPTLPMNMDSNMASLSSHMPSLSNKMSSLSNKMSSFSNKMPSLSNKMSSFSNKMPSMSSMFKK